MDPTFTLVFTLTWLLWRMFGKYATDRELVATAVQLSNHSLAVYGKYFVSLSANMLQTGSL